MNPRLRRLVDVRRGELAPVAFSFSYVALVVASFLLAKPIRNSLFLTDYGPYSLVYVYAAVPVVLSIVMPLAGRLVARIGRRRMLTASLWSFSATVVLFWVLFRFATIWILPAVFYVWVNCYSIIAPVQAWGFVSSLFDTRQAKRLFGLIGAGASLGGIAGGLLGRFLVEPLGGTVNLLLVLALLIASAAVIVTRAMRRMPQRPGRPQSETFDAATAPSFRAALSAIAATPYLRLIAALVFLMAVVTLSISFQLNVQADARFGDDADALTRFFSAFNVYTGLAAFALQLLVTGPLLRGFGMTAAILLLPVCLFSGTALVALVPAFWPVLMTAGLDQGLRFSVDKTAYELLYLPLTPLQRTQLKAVIDIVVSRLADGVGGVLLGIVTGGFLGLHGLGLGLRGTAVMNLALLGAWVAVAWRLRTKYVSAIADSIRTHRLQAERAAAAAVERTAADALDQKLRSGNEADVIYALDALAARHDAPPNPVFRSLLSHRSPEVRRRAIGLLNATGDRRAGREVEPLLRDRDLETRAEALLYMSRWASTDPIAAVSNLEDFPEFSIRASIAAFLSSPGPGQNLEAARLILHAMIKDTGPEAARVRQEAAWLVELRAEAFEAEIPAFLAASEEDPEVVRHAARAVSRVRAVHLAPLLITHLANADAADAIVESLASLGDDLLPLLREALGDEQLPIEARRELPIVLARIGTPAAEQLLVDTLLQGDAGLRYRIIASLNKLRQHRPDAVLDPQVIEFVLAAEILGHYRSYQALGALEAGDERGDVLDSLRHTMEHELERIFRLIALVMPGTDMHSAYVALQAADRGMRANAIEFLESTLDPQLTRLLLPLIDSQVSTAERVRLADGLVGTRIESVEGAIDTLLGSDDEWLRETARAARARLWRPEHAEAEYETETPAAVASGL